MGSEKAMWQALRPLMKGLDPVRVENLVQVGTPDVNYVRGWVELKYLPGWPVRGGIVKIEHFTPQQRVWIIRRTMAGGRVSLMLKVAEEWLLFSGPRAAKYVGKVVKEDLYVYCTVRWLSKPTKEELQKWL
jgi:hypothetical protein